jgi:hypothetical protein
MKSAHWFGLLCSAAVLVFVATFAANYLGGRGGTTKIAKAAPQAKLTFADPATDFPPAPPPAELEIGLPHSHDFWFKSENTQDLPVGVFHKTCQCTSVGLWIAPEDWKEIPKAEEQEKAAKDLESVVKPTELKDKEETTGVVPAGAVGMVRLTWTADHLGQKDLGATLWMGEKGPGLTQVFNIRTTSIGPLKTLPETYAGDIAQEKLPQTIRIKCWSSTRSQFPLKAEVVFSRLKEKSNPFVVGKPTAMTEDEMAKLRLDRRHGAVLAGYWVPVTLNKVSEDGSTAFDLGPFRQRVKLATEGGDPILVLVTGTIQGDLAPVDASAVPVQFAPFNRTTKPELPVVLESETDVIRLELDRNRTPNFLDVEFPKTPETSGGRKTWNLQVKWAPESMASGIFPRDEEGYRDSAVYVRPVYAKSDGPPSYLRIPVVGTADSPP